jgi:hypothetical protein
MQEMFYDVHQELGFRQLIPSGRRVLIFVSQSGSKLAKSKYFKGPCASFEATYVQWEALESKKRNDGTHPFPRFRPASTLATDTAFLGFWEVSDLRPLIPPIPLSDLVVHSTKAKVSSTPRHPMFVSDRAA